MSRRRARHTVATSLNSLENNLVRWRYGDYVADYAGDELAPVERLILDRYRDDLAGRVLELGCGAGRLTGHVIPIAVETHGLDISPAMVAACRRRFPTGAFVEGDMRDLSRYDPGTFDAVIAACNLLDALDHAGREQTLEAIRRVLRPGGLFVMSAHNRAYVPRLRGPARIASRRPKQLAANIAFFPRRIRNHLRLRKLQRFEADYALVNDNSHDYALIHYYVTPQAQVRQLAAHGYAVVEVLDLDCRRLGPEERADRHVRIHYVARRHG
jgi:SAM-dependent methyltransferase